MNISRGEQRVLHVLAQGGYIRHTRADGRRITSIECMTRDGNLLSDCSLGVFFRLKRRGLIESRNGSPYRISRFGRVAVRSQSDNRETRA
ncbi:YjhX family toxin [Consotaella salsifontis]|uniref:YjhX family toxin n=1 Tax=Consotaella salsifontis TaxID=1365950 RepID=UPI00099ADCD6|nr:YjhX family toxin [Consotaella salsifontis]